jgi:hypothetical protein
MTQNTIDKIKAQIMKLWNEETLEIPHHPTELTGTLKRMLCYTQILTALEEIELEQHGGQP